MLLRKRARKGKLSLGLRKGFPEEVRFGLRVNWGRGQGAAMGEENTGMRTVREKGAQGWRAERPLWLKCRDQEETWQDLRRWVGGGR